MVDYTGKCGLLPYRLHISALGYYGGSGLRLTPAVRGRDTDVTAEGLDGPGAARSVSVTNSGRGQNTVLENGYAAMQFTIKDVHFMGWAGRPISVYSARGVG